MLQILDCSKEVLLGKEKDLSDGLQLVNATVSHELRNPLNSLIAQNIEKRALYKELKKVILTGGMDPNTKQQLEKITKQLEQGLNVQESAASMMEFLVQDLLDYAQIKNNKFRKNLTKFNIKEAINQVV